MSTQAIPRPKVDERLQPFLLVVPFTAVITGWFNLSEALPAPLAVVIGAAWGVVLGLLAGWVQHRARLRAWLEDLFVASAVVAVAFAACGGLAFLLAFGGALDAESLTGEALHALFTPAIPYYIVANGLLEMLIMPLLLYLGWRAGRRRIVIVTAAAIYFVMRIWTYLVFVPARLGWAEGEGATQALTAAEKHQATQDLMLNDPRWIVLLAILGLLLIAMHMPAARTGGLVGR
jgi:hypothetical protein